MQTRYLYQGSSRKTSAKGKVKAVMPIQEDTRNIKAKILLLGTCDTKLEEMLFVREQILKQKTCAVLLMDLGRIPSDHAAIDIPHVELVRRGPPLPPSQDAHACLSTLSRAKYIKHMISCATPFVSEMHTSGQIHGIIAVGGSCGTALATAVMRNALPVGFPKLMVSTMASGDVKPFVEETDIMMMYSVVDIAGTNSILNQILTNAAAAITGMALLYATHLASRTTASKSSTGSKKRIGVTMFGVTTPCVDLIRQHLEQKHNYEVYVFHATGAGGKAMERLISEKMIDAVLDVTTTEIADELVGGVLTAGPDRLTAAAKAEIPQVISVGACDMVNFGPRDTVPARFKQDRLLYEHNPAVTLMRTSPEECKRIGEFIADKLRSHASKPELVRVILPTGGVSMLSTPGQPFHDQEADSALFETIERELEGMKIAVMRDARAINDEGFALFAAESLVELIQRSEQ